MIWVVHPPGVKNAPDPGYATQKFINCFLFFWVFFALLDPNPIRSWIRIQYGGDIIEAAWNQQAFFMAGFPGAVPEDPGGSGGGRLLLHHRGAHPLRQKVRGWVWLGLGVGGGGAGRPPAEDPSPGKLRNALWKRHGTRYCRSGIPDLRSEFFFIPGPGSRVKKIPDPGSGSGSASLNLSVFNSKNCLQALGNMIRDVYPGSGSRIRILIFYPFRIPDPGPVSRIRIRNTVATLLPLVFFMNRLVPNHSPSLKTFRI